MRSHEHIDPRELTASNLAKINEYLSSPIKQQEFLKRQEKILSCPPHVLFDQREADIANTYIEGAKKNWLVTQIVLDDGMFSSQALGYILEKEPLSVDLRTTPHRSFSTNLVSVGIERQKDILVVLRNLHELGVSQRPTFFDILESTDMKAFGGVRELPDAHKVQFVGIGDVSKLEDITGKELFHFADDMQVTYDEAVAKATLGAMQKAFKLLECANSTQIVSPRSSGKSTAFAALRQEFPEELYIFKLDKIVKSPEEVLKRHWPTKEGQIAIFDRAEVLQRDPEATQFLVNTFKKAIFLESSEVVPIEEPPTFFSI